MTTPQTLSDEEAAELKEKGGERLREALEKEVKELATANKYMFENYADIGCDESVNYHEPLCCVSQDIQKSIWRMKDSLKETQ